MTLIQSANRNNDRDEQTQTNSQINKQFWFLILVIINQLEQEFSNSVCQRVQVNPMGLEKMISKLNTTKQKD